MDHLHKRASIRSHGPRHELVPRPELRIRLIKGMSPAALSRMSVKRLERGRPIPDELTTAVVLIDSIMGLLSSNSDIKKSSSWNRLGLDVEEVPGQGPHQAGRPSTSLITYPTNDQPVLDLY